MPLGPAAQYLVKYNGQVLPGYAQSEGDDSQQSIASHSAPYFDGSPLSEYLGLANKQLNVTMKLWEPTYTTAKIAMLKARTILRSKRSGFASLYVGFTDRHYNALVKNVSYQKEAGTSTKIIDYDIEFETTPYMISDYSYDSGEIGTGSPYTFSTTTFGRTIESGGWTPTILNLTGTNITVSGYDTFGNFTGFISVSGAVTGLEVDTDKFTAIVGSTNYNGSMYWKDYQMWVGTGNTSFYVTGASSFRVRYNDRWY